MKILILAPYPLHAAPSQRFRFEHFLDDLTESDISWDFQSFLTPRYWDFLYQKGYTAQKIIGILSGFINRLAILSRLGQYEYVLIHRELTPFGPPIFEWLIAKVFAKKIIYDFDDAIWLSDGHDENPFWSWLKWRGKVATICKLSWKVTAGNEFLADFAQNHCDHVEVLPTVVNTNHHQPISLRLTANRQRPTIGWTGSHSTLFYLDRLLPVLQELERQTPFELVVIANKDPKLPLKNYRFIPWSKEREVADLAQIDIGLMPLEDSQWSKGKCGFKLIQYMSLGKPAVASPVGVNQEIITHGLNGFLASSDTEWAEYLLLLLKDEHKRTTMGQQGREVIVDKYSVSSQQSRFIKLFE